MIGAKGAIFMVAYSSKNTPQFATSRIVRRTYIFIIINNKKNEFYVFHSGG
jgi:hypothetical protein